MSRIDDNQKMVEGLKKISFVNRDTAMMVSVLVDISQSLAVMADRVMTESKAQEVDDGK